MRDKTFFDSKEHVYCCSWQETNYTFLFCCILFFLTEETGHGFDKKHKNLLFLSIHITANSARWYKINASTGVSHNTIFWYQLFFQEFWCHNLILSIASIATSKFCCLIFQPFHDRLTKQLVSMIISKNLYVLPIIYSILQHPYHPHSKKNKIPKKRRQEKDYYPTKLTVAKS